MKNWRLKSLNGLRVNCQQLKVKIQPSILFSIIVFSQTTDWKYILWTDDHEWMTGSEDIENA